MSSIRILPAEIANRIAAGEVIERPASVVKELVENSIDAHATRIQVQADRGGHKLLQVTDDGCGMDRDDAMLCLEAHATSKIHEAADIERIQTLGFRGEAIPSIAAVSRFHLQTRRSDALAGCEVLVESGVLRDVSDCGCAPGTNIRVSHLFGNVPARRKFLNQASTEEAHIQETVLLQALAHPEIAFELSLNRREVLRAKPGKDLGDRIAMLLGRETYAAMIPVEYEEGGIHIRGFVARPGLTRSTRREQRFIVNGRPATSNDLHFGVRDAYHTMIMKGRYPPVVLYINLDSERVDVNVHPSKREVRFREGRLVKETVTAAVQRALRHLAGEMHARRQDEFDGLPRRRDTRAFELRPPLQQPRLQWPQTTTAFPEVRKGHGENINAEAATTPLHEKSPANITEHATETEPATQAFPSGGPSPSAATRAEIQSLQILGLFNGLYLVAEGSTGLILIDQHAAHERILFEKLLAASDIEVAAQQQLLLPVTVDLGPEDAAVLRQSRPHLVRIGFGLEPFGGNTFLITAVPPRFPQENISGLLHDIIEDLRQGRPSRNAEETQVRITQTACKHAVKANDALDPEEVQQLLQDLAQTEMPYTCPHGRPVMINITIRELQKRFGRQI